MDLFQVQQIAVRLLSRRDHSVFELKQKLHQRQCEPALVDAVIDTCLSQGWLDDARMAAQLLQGEINKGSGWLRICGKAHQKGISQSLMQQAEHLLSPDWDQLAKAAIVRRFGNVQGTLPNPDTAQRSKCQRFLCYRGFSHSQIQFALSDHSS